MSWDLGVMAHGSSQFCMFDNCSPLPPPFSLSQWLAHQKSCPQCREKCLQRNVLKLFVDSSDASMLSTQSMEPNEMKVGK